MLLSSPSPCGVISPHSTVNIPLALETQVTGAHRSTVYISVFGSQEAPLVSQLSESKRGHMLPTMGVLASSSKAWLAIVYPWVLWLRGSMFSFCRSKTCMVIPGCADTSKGGTEIVLKTNLSSTFFICMHTCICTSVHTYAHTTLIYMASASPWSAYLCVQRARQLFQEQR